MILQDTVTLKALVTELDSRLARNNIKVRRCRLYEILARSQGFKTKAALAARVPILLDKSTAAADTLLESIERYGIKSEAAVSPIRSLLESAAFRVQPSFPCVAGPNCGLVMSIDWDGGLVYLPNERHESQQNSRTWEEFYGHSTSYTLAATVFEDEYRQLCEQIEPYVQTVVDGYTDNGREKSASFTEPACNAQAEVWEIIKNFEFQDGEKYGPDPSLHYGDELIDPWAVKDLKLTQVEVYGVFLLDYSYSDIDLRCLVATELAEDCAYTLVDDESLFMLFSDLRDECKKNYDIKNRTAATAE